ncbi:hypothetical protein [Isoptericola sp. NPDC057391]|uniref:hypothetical protein n=1 Tax=Isoptericola sp. NPDC057391 TaxID=3346117 RepID=UPI00362A153A
MRTRMCALPWEYPLKKYLVTLSVAAEKYGVSVRTIRRRIADKYRHGLPHRPAPRPCRPRRAGLGSVRHSCDSTGMNVPLTAQSNLPGAGGDMREMNPLGAPIWFVTADAYDDDPDAFGMGWPAHWEHLRRDDKERE